MDYRPEQDFYPTNPCYAICLYYGINWDDVCWLDWAVPYGETRCHILELPAPEKQSQRTVTHVNVSLYRMPSGRYEAITYRC